MSSYKIPYNSHRLRSTSANATHVYGASIGSLDMFGLPGENRCADLCRNPGTASGLRIRVTSNLTTAGQAVTLKFRMNTGSGFVDGSQSIGIGQNTGYFEDTVNADALASGDKYTIMLVVGSGGAVTYSMMGFDFVATTDTVVRVRSGDWSEGWANNTRYFGLSASGSGSNTTEADRSNKFGVACTLENLFVFVGATNARVNNTVFGLSKHVATNGNLFVTAGGGVTDTPFEDTVHSDSVTVDDLWSFRVTTGSGTQQIFPTIMAVTARFASSEVWIPAASLIPNAAQNANLTRYLACSGFLESLTTESDARGRINQACTLKKIRFYVSANTVTAGSTLTLYKNGSATGAVVNITASTTGWFEWAGSVSIAAGDDISFQLVTGATGTSLTYQASGIQLDFGTGQSVSVGPAAAALSGIAINAAMGALAKAVTPAVLSLVSQAITGQKGALAKAVTHAAAALSSQPLGIAKGAKAVAMSPATATFAAVAPSIARGAVAKALSPAAATLAAQPVTSTKGARAVAVGPALATWSAQILAPTNATLVSVGPAVSSFAAQSISIQRGALAKAVAHAAASWNARPITPQYGAFAKPVGPALATWSAAAITYSMFGAMPGGKITVVLAQRALAVMIETRSPGLTIETRSPSIDVVN